MGYLFFAPFEIAGTLPIAVAESPVRFDRAPDGQAPLPANPAAPLDSSCDERSPAGGPASVPGLSSTTAPPPGPRPGRWLLVTSS